MIREFDSLFGLKNYILIVNGMRMIDDLSDEYEELIRPRNFFDGWTIGEFIDWCSMAEDEEELWWTYVALYDDGMHYYAGIVLWMLIYDGKGIQKYGRLNVQNYS